MNARLAEPALRLHRPLASAEMGEREIALAILMATGGDARIALSSETGLNRYFSAPYPRDVLSYSSSTISDISPDAFAHLCDVWPAIEGQSYAANLESLRRRIRAALDLTENAASILFAPSGTDLEYVALACALGHEPGGVHNILLGADETGSGCVHSAHGRFFASETALGLSTSPGSPVAGCEAVSLVDVPVRCTRGVARSSAAIHADLAFEVETARAAGKRALVHIIHGSKTGLVLPTMADIDALIDRFGEAVIFVVDACQARVTKPAVHAYLARGCVVLMTGSKFMGAPPFNGWALVPPRLQEKAKPLPAGFARIFRRAEWPADWPGRDILEDSANRSLLLRLNAALFEWERFQAIPMERAERLIDAFETAVEAHLIEPLGLRRVCPYAEAGLSFAGPIEMRTLITLDVSALENVDAFEDAQRLHRALALDGVRLGQPVKCVRLPGDAGWGATLRVGLSMPQMARWAALDAEQWPVILAADMQRIAVALREQAARVRRI